MVEVPCLSIIDGLHSPADLANLHLLSSKGGVLCEGKNSLLLLGKSVNLFSKFFTFFNFSYCSQVLYFLEGPFDLVVNLVKLVLVVGSDLLGAAWDGVLNLSLRPFDFTIHNSYLFGKDR